MPNYNKLYTPQDSAVVFIDHQPQMLFGVASMDRASLINNVTLLAKCVPPLAGRNYSTCSPASQWWNALP